MRFRNPGRSLLVVMAIAVAGAACGQTFNEFGVPTTGSQPFAIAAGADGAIWFTENTGNKIGRITPAGVVTEFPIPTAVSTPNAIAAGPDGALWFTELNGNKIGRITTAGVITEFVVPTAASLLSGITAGSDGALWFTERTIFANKIGRITTSGVITEFVVPTPNSQPNGIAAGSDGALWFTEFFPAVHKIGRITTAGVITEFTVPTANCEPYGIAAGLDGALWFTELLGNKIGRITTTGVITEFSVPTGSSQPNGITAGPDGALWFTESAANKIGRITTAGTITEFPIPTAGSSPFGVTAGPDGAVWFAESSTNKIGRITTGAPCNIDGTTLCLSGDRFKVQAHWATPDGQSGNGQAVQLTGDTGYFWFFGSSNVEMVIKVLDACGINQAFWTFAGGLTNVQVDLTVTDTVSGSVKTYRNPQNTPFQPIQDTAAFPTCSGSVTPTGSDESAASLRPLKSNRPEPFVPEAPSLGPACVADANTLCLSSGRFKVQAHWATPDGQSGNGQAVPLSGDTGYFWFFSASNVEMIVKVLNACGFASRIWVFGGGLTNVQVDLTVTDMQTAAVKTYRNPQNTAFLPIQDTNAFSTCP